MKEEGCQVFMLDRKVPIVKIVEGSQIFHFDTKQAEKRGRWESAGINRHRVGDERALHERIS